MGDVKEHDSNVTNPVEIESTVRNAVDINSKSSSPFSFTQIWQLISSATDPEQPVTVLGREYTTKQEYDSVINSKIWLTYRFGFEAIPKSPIGPSPLSFAPSLVFNKSMFANIQSLVDNENFTNDIGWGCMIRTSQNLLANTYLNLLHDKPDADKLIIDWFQDTSVAPYSIHNFIQVATELPLQVKPGEWFGPNAASLSIKRLCDRDATTPLKVFISESCDLYDTQIKELFNDGPVLILLPVRLGIEKINAYYHSSLKQLLSLKQSVGIAGGKPSSSFYFLGYKDDYLIYLDPHNLQPYQQTNLDYTTYHTLNYQLLQIDNLDPSMLIGILIKDLDDYEDFKIKCTEQSNKVVHFHAYERSAGNEKRRDSEFVKIDHNDLDDEFVDVLKNVEDFVDLGGEYYDDPNEVVVPTEIEESEVSEIKKVSNFDKSIDLEASAVQVLRDIPLDDQSIEIVASELLKSDEASSERLMDSAEILQHGSGNLLDK